MTRAEAIALKEVGKDRWAKGIEHHPKSVALMEALCEIDFRAYGDHFCWKMGGDGDNGETLMFQMDAFFEAEDAEKASSGEVRDAT